MKFKHAKEGFSLVEVIIAVSVLTVLSVPILAYFTHAAVSTSDGKDTHRANLVAQSVAEELNGCATFGQIEEKLIVSTGSPWTVDASYDASARKTELSKTVVEDGFTYQAKVTLDYNYETLNVNGDATESQYNGYARPILQEVYSDTNVVIAETDQIDLAVSNFLYSHPSKTESEIKKDMIRTLCLQLTKKSADIYRVKGFYRYKYNSDTYSADIEDTEIEINKLKNIYFFYNIEKDNVPEQVEIDFDSAITQSEAEKLQIYFVCQKEVKKPQTGYSLVFDTTQGQAAWAKFYTNQVPTNLAASSDMISYDTTGKRIAKILVDVYDGSETSFTEENRIVHLETSKGE